jgi:hypothetical protein
VKKENRFFIFKNKAYTFSILTENIGTVESWIEKKEETELLFFSVLYQQTLADGKKTMASNFYSLIAEILISEDGNDYFSRNG